MCVREKWSIMNDWMKITMRKNGEEEGGGTWDWDYSGGSREIKKRYLGKQKKRTKQKGSKLAAYFFVQLWKGIKKKTKLNCLIIKYLINDKKYLTTMKIYYLKFIYTLIFFITLLGVQNTTRLNCLLTSKAPWLKVLLYINN